MEQEKNRTASLQRITVIDALRGFALLGVILTHMLQHYGIYSFPSGEVIEPLFPKADEFVQWLMQNVLMGKFINIFAFLFGLSFFIQMDRAAKKGIDFRKRFLWRMLILFVIGIIGNCFYTGDILSIYAVFGGLMVLLYKTKNWVLILFASLLLMGLPRMITIGYQQMTKVEQTADSESTQNNRSTGSRTPNMEEPSFLKSVQHNLTRGFVGKLNYQFGIYGRGYTTLALFLLGLVIGRLRFFEEVHIRKRKNVILFAGFVLGAFAINSAINFLPEPPPTRAIFMGLKDSDITPSLFSVMALRDIYSVLFSGALTMGFIVLYQMRGVGNCLDVLSPYGRMGLTNYVMQSVVGCLLFSPWAFGFIFGSWGTTEIFVLGLAVYGGQVIISTYWLKSYLYGLFEWFWRSATYLKLQPLRRKL